MNYTGPFTNAPLCEHPTVEESSSADAASYDFNTTLTVKALQSGQVSIVPLIPSLHADAVSDQFKKDPSIIADAGLWDWNDDWFEKVRQTTARTLSIILLKDKADKPSSGDDGDAHLSWKAAGFIGAWGHDTASENYQTCQIGPMVIFPEYRGTGLFHEAGLLYLDHLFQDSEISEITWGLVSGDVRSESAAFSIGFPPAGKRIIPKDCFAPDLSETFGKMRGVEFEGLVEYDMTRDRWYKGARLALERKISDRRSASTGTD